VKNEKLTLRMAIILGQVTAAENGIWAKQASGSSLKNEFFIDLPPL
jgi:hypothetical protein